MKIALTMRETVDVDEKDSISKDWYKLFDILNATPLLIPNMDFNPIKYISAFEPDLILLTGGGDLKCTNRDRIENSLINHSFQHNVPLLGVCRGMQAINRFFGGTLKKIDYHVRTVHKLDFKTWPYTLNYVNSYHDYAIDSLGENLIVEATSDGCIEAFKHITKPIYGIMWHPERAFNHNDKILIERIANESNNRSSR